MFLSIGFDLPLYRLTIAKFLAVSIDSLPTIPEAIVIEAVTEQQRITDSEPHIANTAQSLLLQLTTAGAMPRST